MKFLLVTGIVLEQMGVLPTFYWDSYNILIKIRHIYDGRDKIPQFLRDICSDCRFLKAT